jgi:dTDP-4-dehydrorhamnose reductase
MSDIVVTGAGGQLGRAFQQLLPHARFLERTDLDLSWPPDRIRETVARIRPGVLLNCAAYTSVDQAEVDFDLAKRVNGLAVSEMANACHQVGARFVTYSSDYVFNGDEVPGGYSEEMPTDPRSAYGRSKVIGELAVLQSTNATVIRTSWVFGEGKNFFLAILRLAKEDSTARIPVVTDQIGRPTYAQDLATATLQMIQLETLPSILHISNDGPPASWCDLAEATLRRSGRAAIPEPVTTEQFLRRMAGKVTAPRPRYSVFDLTRLKSLGIEMRPWTEALSDFLASREAAASTGTIEEPLQGP